MTLSKEMSLCKEEKTVNHIISKCNKLGQKEYKKKNGHYCVGTQFTRNWVDKQWYEHKLETTVLKIGKCLQDPIQT